ncbi:MAG: PilZ domain-containing protein [Sphingomicrobium sp.]
MDQVPIVPATEGDQSGLPERAERPERRPVAFHAHLVIGGGMTLDVRVLDLSYDGCQVEVPKAVFEGDAVELAVEGRGAIQAMVRWCKDGRAGLKFADEPQLKAKVDRNADRHAAGMEAQLRRIGRLSYSVELRDLSPDGCMIDLVERPAIGEVMQIKLPGLETLEAQVRWVDNYIAGLKFVRPMHPAVFDLLLQRLGR